MTKSVEYSDVYDSTLRDIQEGNVDDVYKDIISKERIHMDMLNRIIQQKEDAKLDKPMVELPVQNVVYRVFRTLLDVVEDIRARKTVSEVFRSERRLYLGMFLVFSSVCFIVLYKAN